MEKLGQLLEILIKFIFAMFSTVACIFVVKNAFSMLSFFNLKEVDDALFYKILGNTQIGKVYNSMGVVIGLNMYSIICGILAFIINIEWICVAFLIIFIGLLTSYFIFIKWKLIKAYLKMCLALMISYIVKYLIVLLFLAILNDNSMEGFYLAFKVGAVFYFLISLIELFILSLWILKFFINIYSDIRQLTIV